MAMFETSRGNALPAIGTPGSNPQPGPDDEPAEDEAEPEREPVPEKPYQSAKERLANLIEDHNIARHLTYEELGTIGALVVSEYEIDEQSRAEWKEEAEQALKFATQKNEAKQYPWQNASNIIFPLITQAAFQFSAVSYPALITDRNIAKGATWGSDNGTPATKNGKPDGAPVLDQAGNPTWVIPPGAKTKRAARIGEHMSYQLLEEMPEWEPQVDTLLMQLPIVGGAVRKTWRDTAEMRNRSDLVPMLDLVWNLNATSFETAPRHTEILRLYPDEVVTKERADETFLPIVYGPGDGDPEGDSASDTLAPYEFLEQHRRYDLDQDGYAEPYIITVHKRTSRVVRMVARFEERGITENDEGEIQRVAPVDYYTLYRFLPNPKGGSYPVGFGHLLKPLNEGINTTLNQMFDAGHLQIAGGGFIGTSLSVASGPINFQIGEYRPVNNKGSSIRDSVFPIPFPGPSSVLFQLLGFLVEAAKDVASLQNILAGDPSLANVQPTTLLALIEQGMRLYTSIYKRVFRSLKSELDKLYRLNRLYLEKEQQYQVGDSWSTISPDDYRLGGGVVPAADPNMVTDMQKLSRAMVLASFKDDPMCNGMEIRKRLFEAARVEKIEDILKQPAPDPKMQMDLALSQAQLGRARAAESKDLTQAILNISLARKTANEAQLGYFDSMIDVWRTHLEAINSTIKAADVDAKFYGHNVRMKQAGDSAQGTADDTRNAIANGAGAGQPAGPGNQGGGIPAVAPPSGNGALPPLPAPPGG